VAHTITQARTNVTFTHVLVSLVKINKSIKFTIVEAPERRIFTRQCLNVNDWVLNYNSIKLCHVNTIVQLFWHRDYVTHTVSTMT